VRVAFDHCVPRSLRRLLAGHEIRTAAELGREEFADSSIIRAASWRFDVIVSVDRLFAAGADVPAAVAVVILRARSNSLRDLAPVVPDLLSELASPRRGERVEIGPLAG
jgi:hypothetical protein